MAGFAVRTKLAFVSVILLVAGIAVGECALENVIDMTARTGNCGVQAGQFEGEQIVVHVGRQPAGGGVAGCAVCAVLAIMFIVLLVAGIAVGGCAFEDVVDVATRTRDVDVFACQFEGGQIVVKGGWRPAGGGVAGTAIGAKAALVGVVPGMAGTTVLRGGLEVCKGTGIDMALPA